MKQHQASSIVFEVFSMLFRQHVHLLLAWGYEYAESHHESGTEEDITGLIYEEIKTVLRSSRIRWCNHYSVSNETPILGSRRTGKSRRKIDLLIEYVTVYGRPEYVFEAKLLNYLKSYQREDNYINEEGLERFIRGDYAEYIANYPEAGMIGYVFSDTLEIWRDRLQKSIDVRKEFLCPIGTQHEIKVIDDFPLEWVSEHSRNTADSPLMICHILLDFCPRTENAISEG